MPLESSQKRWPAADGQTSLSQSESALWEAESLALLRDVPSGGQKSVHGWSRRPGNELHIAAGHSRTNAEIVPDLPHAEYSYAPWRPEIPNRCASSSGLLTTVCAEHRLVPPSLLNSHAQAACRNATGAARQPTQSGAKATDATTPTSPVRLGNLPTDTVSSQPNKCDGLVQLVKGLRAALETSPPD